MHQIRHQCGLKAPLSLLRFSVAAGIIQQDPQVKNWNASYGVIYLFKLKYKIVVHLHSITKLKLENETTAMLFSMCSTEVDATWSLAYVFRHLNVNILRRSFLVKDLLYWIGTLYVWMTAAFCLVHFQKCICLAQAYFVHYSHEWTIIHRKAACQTIYFPSHWAMYFTAQIWFKLICILIRWEKMHNFTQFFSCIILMLIGFLF